jgi:hypothetical protein
VAVRQLSEIIAERNQGVVRWVHRAWLGPDHKPGDDAERPTERIRSILRGAELADVADDLVEIDARQADLILRASLQFDLAYDAEVLSAEATDAAVSYVLGLVDPSTRYFTNRLSLEEPDSDRILGYDRVPSSESTFDSLVVGIGPTSSVLLCVEDED